MRYTSSILLFFLFQYGKTETPQKINTPSGDVGNTHNLFLNDVKEYHDEIISQLETLQNNERLPEQMNKQLKELSDILSVVNETQNAQKERLAKFSRSLEQTKLSLFKMLSEYENRIDQLEYNIKQSKMYDPYMEKYKYPINMFWIKADLANGRSHWKFEKNKNFISIKQSNDLNHLNKPATILILKHHKIIDGFVSVDILQTSSVISKVQHSAAGIVFHFTNVDNFRYVELSFVDENAAVVVGEVVAGVSKKIFSKSVEAKSSEFNTLTCKFENRQISIFLNYTKIIELNDSEEDVKNTIALFTRIGTANFKNVLTGDAEFEKELEQKLQSTNSQMVSKIRLNNSFRFSVINNIDDLSVYEIPHEISDFDIYNELKQIEDVYPVPSSDSYYDEKETFTLGDFQKHANIKEDAKQYTCKEYSKNTFDLQEWSNKNTQYNWKIINEYGITRIIAQTGIKNEIYKAALVYKNSTCNNAAYGVSIKLEYDSEAGLLFRYDNKENMYIATISTKTKDLVLKKIKNDAETIIKTQRFENINSLQRQLLHINDEGQKGTITIFLDNEQVLSVNDEFYYKSGVIGLYVEKGFATFDNFYIRQAEKAISSTNTSTS